MTALYIIHYYKIFYRKPITKGVAMGIRSHFQNWKIGILKWHNFSHSVFVELSQRWENNVQYALSFYISVGRREATRSVLHLPGDVWQVCVDATAAERPGGLLHGTGSLRWRRGRAARVTRQGALSANRFISISISKNFVMIVGYKHSINAFFILVHCFCTIFLMRSCRTATTPRR